MDDPIRVGDIDNGEPSSSPSNLKSIGETLFFAATDRKTGKELWKVVPPYTTPVRVSDINPGGASSFPNYLTVIDDILFFVADNGEGREVWMSEPPYDEESTRLVVKLSDSTNGSEPADLHAIGNAVFFSADDGSIGRELWKIQPPYQSAENVVNIFPGVGSSNPQEFVHIGWMLFFIAGDDAHSRQVWGSLPPYDSSSTVRLTDLNKQGEANIPGLTVVQNSLFFSANDGESGQQLWKLESPYTEPKRVTNASGDLDREVCGSTLDHRTICEKAPIVNTNPGDLFPLGSNLFFSGNGVVSGTDLVFRTNGIELRRSEPPYEATSTYLVEEINGGDANPTGKTAIDTTLFFNADDGSHGSELWKSIPPYDADNTEMVYDIFAGTGGSNPHQMTAFGKTLYFTAHGTEYGFELWKTLLPYDDTTTVLAADICKGTCSSRPHDLYVLNHTLFFVAYDQEHGEELWRIDTASSSWLYQSISGSGSGSSSSTSIQLPLTGFKPNVNTIIEPQPSEEEYSDLGEMHLVIPTLGKEIPIVGVSMEENGWNVNWINDQAGYLEGTAFPTHNGNSVITGHSILPDGNPGPFAQLTTLKWGDRIEIHAWNQRYIFEIRSTESVTPDDLGILKHEDLPWITLMTCQNFNEKTNAYQNRLVVKAVLLEIVN